MPPPAGRRVAYRVGLVNHISISQSVFALEHSTDLLLTSLSANTPSVDKDGWLPCSLTSKERRL